MEPSIIFTSSSQEQVCRTVILINDSISEGMEFFLIDLTTLAERVELSDAVNITILDDDSKYTLFSLNKFTGFYNRC